MANVEFPGGIKGVSGTLYKKTIRTRDGIVTKRVVATYSKRTGKQRIYLRISDSNKRTTPISENESRQRAFFAQANAYAVEVLRDQERLKVWHAHWKAHKRKFRNKEYVSLRGYIVAFTLAGLKAGINIDNKTDINAISLL